MHAPARSRSRSRPDQTFAQGFTLIEVLVALAILAVMALMSWRGLDAMMRSVDASQSRTQAISRVQAGLAQWETDLAAALAGLSTPALDYDGRTLRLTRSDPDPASPDRRVVAWTYRQTEQGGRWLRWQSAGLRDAAELQQAWQLAQQWARSPTPELLSREVSIAAIDSWQLYYYRGEAWVNPQSSPTEGSGSALGLMPDAVRLVLNMRESEGLQGRVQKDWLRPAYTGKKT